MACQIHRTKDGKINKVTAPNGSRSKLFDAINNNIFMSDAETSVKIMNNAYSKVVEKAFEGEAKYKYDTGEPQLFYVSHTNKQYENLEEALINEDFGNMTMGFKNPKTDEFMPIANFTTKGSQKNEFLHSKVREGLISAERVMLEDGTMRFQGKGEYETTKRVLGHFVVNDLMAELGTSRFKLYEDGTIDIKFEKGYTTAIDSDGNPHVIRTETVPEFLKNNPDAVNKLDILREYVAEFDNPIPLTPKRGATEAPMTDLDSIEDSLYGFLESLGFSVSTLEEYRATHNTKYGEGKHIGAIADIANMVVAVNEGTMTVDDLSEEVSHIAIAAYSDRNSIVEALANVHLTPEYAEHSETYRALYSKYENPTTGKLLTPVQVEEKVRKEILGKILSKEIVNRFQTQNKTSEQVTLISRLRDIWRWFSNMMSNVLKPYHTRFLEDLNRDIANSVLSKASEDFKAEFSEVDDFFYSLLDQKGLALETELRRSKAQLEDLFNNRLKEPIPNKAELDRISVDMATHDIVSSVNNVVSVSARQLKVLKDGIDHSKRTGEMLSREDRARYEALKEQLIPTVENLIAGLSEIIASSESRDKYQVTPELKANISTIIDASKSLTLAEVNPYINDAKLTAVEAQLDKYMEHSSLTEEEKKKEREALKGGMRDLGWMGAMFGLASQSKNIVLQMMYMAVNKIATKTNYEFLGKMNQFLKDSIDRGHEKYQRNIIQRDSDGNVTHYWHSDRDYAWTEKEKARRENEYLAKETGMTVEEVAKKRAEGIQPNVLLRPTDPNITEELANKLQEERYQLFRDASSEIHRDLHEQMFTEEYYKIRDERYDRAGVSAHTRRYLATKNSSMNYRHIKAGVFNEDGTRDLSRLSEKDKQADIEDFKKHARAASPYDSLGNLKDGIIRKRYADLTQSEKESIPVPIDPNYTGDVTLVAPNTTLDKISTDARIALDIFHLNMLYRSEMLDETKSNDAVDRFIKEIEDIENSGDNALAFQWMMANSSLGFTSDFYENMGTNSNYNTVAQNYIDQITDPTIRKSRQAELDNIMDLQRSRKELLKQNKKPGSISETDVKHMTDQARARLLELDNKIIDARRKLSIPSEEFDDIGGVEHTATDLNEDFYRMLKESGLSAYEFSIQHMSESAKNRMYQFSRSIEDYVMGRTSSMRVDFEEFADEVSRKGLLEGKSTAELIDTLKDEYAKNNVASYFKRFQPQGYTELINDLKDGTIKASTILNNKESLIDKYPALKYVEVNPDYAWREDVNNDKYKNPRFKTNDPMPQPKKLNETFFKTYGISEEDYWKQKDADLSNLTPTQNKEQFSYLVNTIATRKEIIENYNDTGRVNPFLRTQVRKEAAERSLTIYKTGFTGLKDWASDFATSQEDEKEYGEIVEGTDIKIKTVPKYYQNRIEDPSLITENSMQALLMDLKASIRYKNRLEFEGEVKALEYMIEQQGFKARGGNKGRSRITKMGQASNYYQKAQEMADYHLYGIRQNRQMTLDFMGKEIHLDQIFSRITQYVRNVNLAFNPLVDITSYTTGVYNNLIDTVSGDYYHRSAALKAEKMLPSMIVRYMSEEGRLDKKTELAHLSEFFGIESPEEDRLSMSSYGRGTRIASNSFYLMSKYANLPVTPRNMIAVLHDYKWHNGRFKSFNDFARDMRAEDKGLKRSAIDGMWNKLDDTFYSNLTIDPDLGVQMSDKFKSKFDTEEQANQEFEFYHGAIMAKIAHINQNVDAIVSQGDQLKAQRDALVNAFMLHRSWFIINMSRKFKSQHYNLATGQYEAGHYMTALSSIQKMFRNLKGDRAKLSEVLEAHEIRNLKRAGFDSLALLILIGITNMLMAGDDDDDSYVENLAQLIAMRTTNETWSQNIYGIGANMLDIYKDPLVQAKTIEGLFGVYNVTDEKARTKFLKQLLPYRRYTQLSDLEYQLSAYMHFNSNTLLGVTAVGEEKSK